MNENILITAAGRRVSLLRGFQDVAAARGSRVLASDADPPSSAACQLSDGAHRLPAATDPRFVDELFALCQRESIGLVVPTIDPELPVLSKVRSEFERSGIHIAVSDPELIAECEDKRQTKQLFERHGLDCPNIFDWPNVPEYPIFVKPYDGSASKGTAVVHTADEAVSAFAESEHLIACEYIDPLHHDEFTVDCYFDRTSALRCAVPRQRIEVRGGEVAKARTVQNELVDELFDRLARLPGARGVLTVQAFIHREQRTSSFLEINARLSGGYPLTRRAGADYQRYLVDEYLDGVAPPTSTVWQDHALMLRYDAEVVVFDV